MVRLILVLKKLSAILLTVLALAAAAQTAEEEALLASLPLSNAIPADLLSTRTVVLFQNNFSTSGLEETQKYFQQTGIDAVCYFDVAYVLAGADTRKAYANYFSFRNIKYIVLLRKEGNQYCCVVGTFCGNKDLFDQSSTGWRQSNESQVELLRTIYRSATSNLKKRNFLINDLPELDISMTYFMGRFNQSFSLEAKSFKTAVPKMENENENAALEAFLQAFYPFKYEMVDTKAEESELVARGFRIILRMVHTQGNIAREILGYDPTQTGRALATTYYAEGVPQIKTIPAGERVYKFYMKNIEYGNVFLGTKWDADLTWQDALRNYIMALRADAKIN